MARVISASRPCLLVSVGMGPKASWAFHQTGGWGPTNKDRSWLRAIYPYSLEWCLDSWHVSYQGAPLNGSGPQRSRADLAEGRWLMASVDVPLSRWEYLAAEPDPVLGGRIVSWA